MTYLQSHTGLNVPLIFSVTGHVDLFRTECEDTTELEKELYNFFISYKQEYHHTDMILMTALAEGADRIAASAAARAGIMIAPVLPFSPNVYKETFEGNGYEGDRTKSINDFNRILEDKSTTFDPYIITTGDKDTNQCYLDMAAYLVANSHILVALWDGRRYEKSGGTYDVVRMAFSGIDYGLQKVSRPMSQVTDDPIDTHISKLTVTEDCPIFWMEVNRLASEKNLIEKGCMDLNIKPGESRGYIVPAINTKDIAYAFKAKRKSVHKKNQKDSTIRLVDIKHSPSPESDFFINQIGETHIAMNNWFNSLPEYYNDIFSKIDNLNEEMGAESSSNFLNIKFHEFKEESLRYDIVKPEKWKSRNYLLDGLNPISERIKEKGVMDNVALRYSAVDSLAIKYQSQSNNVMGLAIIISAFTILFFSFFILFNSAVILMLLYGICFIAGKYIYTMHKNKKRYLKFIEYRTLAESMRVTYYWNILGIDDSVSTSCYGYMKNETMWIRSVLKSWNSFFINDYSMSKSIDRADRIKFVKTSWIGDQIKYHRKKMKRNGELIYRNNRATVVLSSIIILLIAVTIIASILFIEEFNVILFTIPSLIIGNMTLLADINFTGFIILKIIMVAFAVLFGYSISKKDTIRGGTPEQIKAKRKMFEIAALKIVAIDKSSDENKEILTLEIFHELGIQCVAEVNDWAFEHKTKDIKAPREQTLVSSVSPE